MKIRSQLIAGIIVFVLLLTIIAGVVIVTNQQIDKFNTQYATANRIVIEVSDLGYLSNDYILYREPVQADRWNTEFASTAGDIASLSVDQPEQQTIVSNLESDLRNTKSTFDDVRLSPVPLGGPSLSFVQLSWDRMDVQDQGMIFDANRLSSLIQVEADGLKTERTVLIILLMGAFGALLLTGYLLIYRRTLKSFTNLQQGAKIIGSGDLNHKIVVESDDEIKDLAQSFNLMTSDLKTVLATKTELEREIAGRKQAEVDLRVSEEKYRNLFTNMTEEVHFWQLIRDSYGQIQTWRLVDANPPTLKTWGKTREEILGKTTDEIFGPGATEHYMPVVQKIMTEGVPYSFVDYFPNLDKYFRFTSVPLGNYFITTGADVTEIKKAEDALKKKNEDLNSLNEELTATQEELHQNLEELSLREQELIKSETELRETAEQRQLALDAAQLGWWHYDPVTRVSQYDKRYREIFGVPGEEMPNDEILASRIHPDDLTGVWKKVEAALDPVSPKKYSVEYRIVLPGGIIKWIEAHGEVVFEGIGKNRRAKGFSGTVADISGYKFDEDIINLSNEIFRISADSSNLPDMFSGYVKLLHRYTGFKAIGIRILDDEGNIPYQANIGFTEDFLQHESPLSIQFDNCMCINVIKGTTDPSLPFYTEHGSFYINATTKFLATVSEEEKGKTRNMCNKVGYESVALIPIHKGGRILGLLHLADPREGMVPLRTIKILENVALSMGSPILRMNAEEELKFKNESLNKLNENLTSIQEDLREVNDALQENERQLLKKNENLNALNEELTATQEELHQNLEELSLREQELVKRETELKEALSEKEVLLSEIHHRVKNNLTAFISLLSLDGSYEDTESGRALRKDLQNRARSMALIHETLYRTGKFSKVDMGIYLKNLVDQVAQSYNARSDVHVAVNVSGTLSIDRATTAGLIINELVTNSFKYAFPPGFDCMAVHEVPCMIRVSLANEDGTDVLRVSDNGCGFRESFDPMTSKSLGLKLVNFLSRHQLLADISIQRDKGTEFIFRLKNTENNP
jgi:two-component sensor histidine kinase/PAS domain-containing protein